MSFTIRLLILLKGRFIGSDSFGNKYYEEKIRGSSDGRQPRRWIIYKGMNEASKVPPEWHAWLHYRADQPLQGQVYAWQKPHQPNLTGISGFKDNDMSVKRDNVTHISKRFKKSYEPWKPNE
jgi:NADH:ubiquinone oxidoreductase subunit